jgi:hypothetical protein
MAAPAPAVRAQRVLLPANRSRRANWLAVETAPTKARSRPSPTHFVAE